MTRPIAISLSPNTNSKDVFLAFKAFFFPWKFLNGNNIRLLEQWFRQYYKTSYAISFVSGRGTLFAILKCLGIQKGDEVILQAFTCVAVAESIIGTGAKPVYVDINNSLTIDITDVEKNITSKTKAIIVQHTFGIPSEIEKIIKIAEKKNIIIIEDCAHLIGTSYKNKKLGLFSKAAFFSFGRDKAFSSVFGGMVITNDKNLGKKLRMFQRQQGNPSFFWILQQLFHPFAFYFILSVYNFFSLGKIILFILQKIKFLSFPILPEEKQGILPKKFLKKLPNALCGLALFQLKRIKEYNQRREDLSSLYLEEFKNSFLAIPYNKKIPFLRFPLIVENRDKIINIFKKKGIYIGKWYSEIIDPKGVDFDKIFYKKGSCPNAELISKKIINLPTYPTLSIKEAEKVVKILKNHA